MPFYLGVVVSAINTGTDMHVHAYNSRPVALAGHKMVGYISD